MTGRCRADCPTRTRHQVNNGGSDGVGSAYVTIENVRLNDYFLAQDAPLMGAQIEGNTECLEDGFSDGCCLWCHPNGIRSSQARPYQVPEAIL